MSDHVLSSATEQTAQPQDPETEFVMRHIPFTPLLALLVSLGTFVIFFVLLAPV